MEYEVSNAQAGKALKALLDSLNNRKPEAHYREPRRCCNSCKYRHMIMGEDEQWGNYEVVQNWCDIDRALMDSRKAITSHFSEECPYYEHGHGTVEETKRSYYGVSGLSR